MADKASAALRIFFVSITAMTPEERDNVEKVKARIEGYTYFGEPWVVRGNFFTGCVDDVIFISGDGVISFNGNTFKNLNEAVRAAKK